MSVHMRPDKRIPAAHAVSEMVEAAIAPKRSKTELCQTGAPEREECFNKDLVSHQGGFAHQWLEVRSAPWVLNWS